MLIIAEIGDIMFETAKENSVWRGYILLTLKMAVFE